ncbi:MAG: hypothetical protein QM723_13225 [Myxococcaceae bacterium]
MPKRNFDTVTEELLPCATALAEHLAGHGYSVVVEAQELAYPYTPTLRCKRRHTTVLIEVAAAVDIKRLLVWAAFCKSSGSDTRIAIAVPTRVRVAGTAIDRDIAIADADLLRLQEAGVGLYRFDGSGVMANILARDLGVNIALPALDGYPREIREALGPAYDHFEQTNWREAYEEAAKALESAARRYLKRWSKLGRIMVLKAGVATRLTPGEIDKMTMGGLATAYGKIQAPNLADTTIEKALRSLNKDRIGVVHKNDHKRTEKNLRKNVGTHMWTIIAALQKTL